MRPLSLHNNPSQIQAGPTTRTDRSANRSIFTDKSSGLFNRVTTKFPAINPPSLLDGQLLAALTRPLPMGSQKRPGASALQWSSAPQRFTSRLPFLMIGQ